MYSIFNRKSRESTLNKPYAQHLIHTVLLLYNNLALTNMHCPQIIKNSSGNLDAAQQLFNIKTFIIELRKQFVLEKYSCIRVLINQHFKYNFS